MKKIALIVAFLIFSSANSIAQIIFERGYFIDDSGTRVEALIRNVDWRSNPDRFEYKLAEGGEVRQADIKSVKEFRVYGASRYVRAKVRIDRSSDRLDLLSDVRNPVFEDEVLFLRVLVEGDATLYMYVDVPLIRFFYRVHDSEISQLVYKRYSTSDNQIGRNNFFMQQIINDLKCDNISPDRVRRIHYTRRSLEQKFIKYNRCMDPDFVVQRFGSWRNLFNLTLQPGLSYNNLTIEHQRRNILNPHEGSMFSYRFGVQAEFIVPYYRNSWSILFEPGYQQYRVGNTVSETSSPNVYSISRIDYQSIEFPFGIRYYIFLNDASKLFVNVLLVLDYSIRLDVSYTNGRSGNYSDFVNNLAFGSGFRYRERYSIEARYYTNRDIFNNSQGYDFFHDDGGYSLRYSAITMTLGYTLF